MMNSRRALDLIRPSRGGGVISPGSCCDVLEFALPGVACVHEKAQSAEGRLSLRFPLRLWALSAETIAARKEANDLCRIVRKTQGEIE